jgi:epsilon-lactone hydrolase
VNSASHAAASAQAPWCVVHPVAPRDQTVMAEMRAIALPNKGKLRGTVARVAFDGIIGSTSAPPGVTFRQDTIRGLDGWWCKPVDPLPNAAILHLHGGWFNWGTAEAFRHLVGHIARSAGATAFVPNYRLAPENPFPAAVDDALACFLGIHERGIRAIAVTGDSAGGNLALSLLSLIATRSDKRAVQPIGAVALSPVTDLAMTGSSWESRADADPFFVRDQSTALIAAYLNGHDAADPIASPLYGSLAGLPPIRVHLGDDEVLRDDSLRYVQRCVAAGVDATVDVWEGMPHGFIGHVGQLEASAEVLKAIGAFLSASAACCCRSPRGFLLMKWSARCLLSAANRHHGFDRVTSALDPACVKTHRLL